MGRKNIKTSKRGGFLLNKYLLGQEIETSLKKKILTKEEINNLVNFENSLNIERKDYLYKNVFKDTEIYLLLKNLNEGKIDRETFKVLTKTIYFKLKEKLGSFTIYFDGHFPIFDIIRYLETDEKKEFEDFYNLNFLKEFLYYFSGLEKSDSTIIHIHNFEFETDDRYLFDIFDNFKKMLDRRTVIGNKEKRTVEEYKEYDELVRKIKEFLKNHYSEDDVDRIAIREYFFDIPKDVKYQGSIDTLKHEYKRAKKLINKNTKNKK